MVTHFFKNSIAQTVLSASMDYTELAPERFATHSRSIPFIQMQFLHLMHQKSLTYVENSSVSD